MKAAAHEYFGLLVVTLLMVSCANVPQGGSTTSRQMAGGPSENKPSGPISEQIYFQSDSNSIQVLISGSKAQNAGQYYLKVGSTLGDALLASGNLYNKRSGDSFCVQHKNDSFRYRKEYRISHLTESEMQQPLINGDCLSFPGKRPL